MTKTHSLALVPRDGFFCKDGKGWHTSTSGRGHSLEWPWPSTVLGALRTAWGRQEQVRTKKTFNREDWRIRTEPIQLERTLVLRRPHGVAGWASAHTVWPVPQDALWLEGRPEVYRLSPVPPRVPTLGRDDDEVRERLWYPVLEEAQKPLTAPRWWSHAELSGWLAGDKVPVQPGRLAPVKRLQAHVGIEPETLTAEESVLFSHDVVETLEAQAEWAIGVEVALPEGARPEVATLGSDGRLAKIEALPAELLQPPKALLESFRRGSRGLRLMIVTPASFERGWLPDGLSSDGDLYRGRLPGLEAEVILRAALVPRPLAISGWDQARGQPKPTARMVAPGSVYYFERADEQPFGEADARALWLAGIGTRTAEGFGRIVPGIWTPGESSR